MPKMAFGDMPSAVSVKLTMSANITVTSGKPSAMVPVSAFKRSATEPGRMLRSRRSERICSSFSRACASAARARDFSPSTAAKRSRKYTRLETATKLTAKMISAARNWAGVRRTGTPDMLSAAVLKAIRIT